MSESQAKWSSLAKHRFEQIENGKDITFWKVFLPIFTSAILDKNYKNIVEIGCGTGHLAREIAKLNIPIDAIEPAIGMFECAQIVTSGFSVGLHNVPVESFVGDKKYDLVLSHMCVNSVENLEKHFKCIQQLAKREFIFSATHPIFWYESVGWAHTDEEKYHEEHCNKERYLRITRDEQCLLGPIVHWHRSFEQYSTCLSNSGFSILEIKEVMPAPNISFEYGKKWEYPRYVVFKCALL